MEGKRERSSNSCIEDLPTELLQQIFRQLDLEPLTLVNKLFCSVSSSLVRKLTFKLLPLNQCAFGRLFKRFPSVTIIRIKRGKPDGVLLAVSKSSLNLKKLQLWLPEYPSCRTLTKLSKSSNIQNIKSLKLAWLFDSTRQGADADQSQVVKLIELFPSLTELDLRHSGGRWWNDDGIESVSSKLPNLRKIKLNGYFKDNQKLTDETLVTLSSNCLNLESVSLEGCEEFSPEALCDFLRNNPRLVSLDMPEFSMLDDPPIPQLIECMQLVKNLEHISLGESSEHDDILKSLAKSRPPLKSLRIQPHSSVSVTGLTTLLKACPRIERLDVDVLSSWASGESVDTKMSRLVKGLPRLKQCTIRSSNVPYHETLVSLVEHCPLLKAITLERKSKKKSKRNPAIEGPTTKNYSIRSIEIKPKADIWLRKAVKSCCPNLRKILR